MNDSTKENLAGYVILSSAVTIISIALLTILAELNPALKNWLTITFSHHWIGKSFVSLLIFVTSFGIFWASKIRISSITRAIWILTIAVNLAFVIILAFFFFEAI